MHYNVIRWLITCTARAGPIETADFCVSMEPGCRGLPTRTEASKTDTPTNQTPVLTVRVEVNGMND